jgi:GPH family glycoside/pentoside/hexuronide:cation symporter
LTSDNLIIGSRGRRFTETALVRTKRRATNDGALSTLGLAALSAPFAALAAAGMPLAVYLPPYYAQDLGLGLPLVGAIFMLSRIWDAATDPLIGSLSDATRSRFGRRKPWIAAGAPIFALAAAAIFAPGLFGVHPNALWLGAWLAVFFLGWTMIQIPLSAWGGELSGEYQQRSRVATYVQGATAIGLLTVLILPVLLGKLGSTETKTLSMGMFIVATALPTVSAALFLVREPPLPPASATRTRPWAALPLLLREPLLMRILASDFAVTLGQTVRGSLFVFFVSAYAGRPDLAAGLFLLQFVFGVFVAPIWLRISYRLGKHRTAVAAELLQTAINLGLLAVAPNSLPLLVGLTIAQGLTQSAGNLMLRATVADVADKHRLETGQDRTGLFFSVFSLATKFGQAAAVGVALPLVAFLGFRPGQANAPEALDGLKLVFALGPALAHLVSAALMAGFSLDARRHGEIRRALADTSPTSADGRLAAAE